MKKLLIGILIVLGLIGAAYIWSRQPDELSLQVLLPQNEFWNQPSVTVRGMSPGADSTVVTARVGDTEFFRQEVDSKEWSLPISIPVSEGDLVISATAVQNGWFIYRGQQAQQEDVFRVDLTPPVIIRPLSAATPNGLLVNGSVQDNYSGIQEVRLAGYPATVDGSVFSGYIPWEQALLMSAIEVRATDNALNMATLPVNMQFPEEYTVVYNSNGVAIQASPTLGLPCPTFDVYFKNVRCHYVSRRLMGDYWVVRRFDPYPPMIALTVTVMVLVIAIVLVARSHRRRLATPALVVAAAVSSDTPSFFEETGPVDAPVAVASPPPTSASGPRLVERDSLWQRLMRSSSGLRQEAREILVPFLRENRNLPGGDAALLEAARNTGDPVLMTLIEEVNRG